MSLYTKKKVEITAGIIWLCISVRRVSLKVSWTDDQKMLKYHIVFECFRYGTCTPIVSLYTKIDVLNGQE